MSVQPQHAVGQRVTRKVPILCNVSAPSYAAIKPFLAQNGVFRGSEKPASPCKKHHIAMQKAPFHDPICTILQYEMVLIG